MPTYSQGEAPSGRANGSTKVGTTGGLSRLSSVRVGGGPSDPSPQNAYGTKAKVPATNKACKAQLDCWSKSPLLRSKALFSVIRQRLEQRTEWRVEKKEQSRSRLFLPYLRDLCHLLVLFGPRVQDTKNKTKNKNLSRSQSKHKHLKFQRAIIRAFEKTTCVISRLVTSAPGGVDEVNAALKYHHNCLMSKIAENEDPIPIPGSFPKMFFGIVWRRLSRAVVKRDKRSNRFIYSIKNLSSQLPQATPYKLVSTFESHQNCMTKSHPDIPEGLIQKLQTIPSKVFQKKGPKKKTQSSVQIENFPKLESKSTCSNDGAEDSRTPVLYGISRWCNRRPMVKFLPNGHATFAFSRKKGGSKAEVCNLRLPPQDPLVPDRVSIPLALEKWKQEEFEKSLERYRADIDLDNCPTIDDAWNSTAEKVVALPENAKFRIISVGNANRNNCLQPIQGALLSGWKDTSWSTMRHEDLTPRVARMIRKYPDLKFISWDYKSATDLLNRKVAVTILKGLPSWMTDTALREALHSFSKPGRMCYPEVKGWEDEILAEAKEIRHSQGQLMGHPLSFPLLCVVNVVCLKQTVQDWITEATSKKERKRRKQVGHFIFRTAIINGDDICFRGNEFLFQRFQEVTKQLGLQKSIGKCYLSKSFCTINSQVFRLIKGGITRIGYVNFNILNGSPGKERVVATPSGCANGFNKMFTHCPEAKECLPLLFDRFKNQKNKDRVISGSHGKKWFHFRPNWFLPRELGGLGINPQCRTKKEPLRPSRRQRLMMSHFIQDPSNALFRVSRREVKSDPRLEKLRTQKSRFAGSHVRKVDDDTRKVFTLPGPTGWVPEETTFKYPQDEGWDLRIMQIKDAMSDKHGESGDLEEDVLFFRNIKFNPDLKPVPVDRVNFYLRPENRIIQYSHPYPCPQPHTIQPVPELIVPRWFLD